MHKSWKILFEVDNKTMKVINTQIECTFHKLTGNPLSKDLPIKSKNSLQKPQSK